jgi:deoxycytidylate deaminase
MSVQDENNHIIYKCRKCGVIYRDDSIAHICQGNCATGKHRLTIEEYGCLLSLIGKGRSEDPHTRCSAVGISDSKRILGISYNGLKSGVKIPKWMYEEKNRIEKGEMMIHAEKNLFALIKKGDCNILCMNISPCVNCGQTIAANDVREVVYIKEYHRCDKFKKLFKLHNIKYRELTKKEKQNIKNYLIDMNNFSELE